MSYRRFVAAGRRAHLRSLVMEERRAVLNLLAECGRPVAAKEIVMRTALTAGDVSAALTRLMVRGLVVSVRVGQRRDYAVTADGVRDVIEWAERGRCEREDVLRERAWKTREGKRRTRVG